MPYFALCTAHPCFWPKISGKKKSFTLCFNSIFSLFIFRNKTDYCIPGYYFAYRYHYGFLESHFQYIRINKIIMPWLVWCSGLRAGLQTKGLPVQFPVRANAWVAVWIPSKGCTRGNHTLMFLSLSFSLPSPLSKTK